MAFNTFDKYEDLIVYRDKLIDFMKNDKLVIKILKIPAVKIPTTNKIINVEKILDQIKEEYNNGTF